MERLAIAVGSNGTVLTTDDDGLAWTERESGSSAWLRSVAFDASTGRAIAVGAGGTVLTSNDRGFTWAERDSGTSASLESVVFDASTGRAIAVGAGGTVLTSSDGGVTWAERDTGIGAITPNPSRSMRAPAAPSPWGLGAPCSPPTIAASRGSSPIPAPAHHSNPVAFDASTDRAIGRGGWGHRAHPPAMAASRGPSAIPAPAHHSNPSRSMRSTGRATLVGTIGTVLTSDDYGVIVDRTHFRRRGLAHVRRVRCRHWSRRRRGTKRHRVYLRRQRRHLDRARFRLLGVARIRRIRCGHPSRHCCGVKRYRAHVRRRRRQPGPSAIPALRWVSLSSRSIRKWLALLSGGGTKPCSRPTTTASLGPSAIPGSWWQSHPFAFDATTGRAILVWADGTVFTSDDSGDTWIERESGTSASLLSVAYDAEHRPRHCRGDGRGRAYLRRQRRSRGPERDSGSAAWIYSVAYDATTGRAIGVGAGGAVLTSDDDGVTWTERDSGSAAWIYSVAFDGSTGRAIAVGIGGTPIISDDAGVTWTPRTVRGKRIPSPAQRGRIASASRRFWSYSSFNPLTASTASSLPGGRAPTCLTPVSRRPQKMRILRAPAGSTYFKRILDLFVSDRPVVPEDEDSSELGRSAYREGILDLLVSDRPLGSGGQDRLGYDLYVRGLSGTVAESRYRISHHHRSHRGMGDRKELVHATAGRRSQGRTLTSRRGSTHGTTRTRRACSRRCSRRFAIRPSPASSRGTFVVLSRCESICCAAEFSSTLCPSWSSLSSWPPSELTRRSMSRRKRSMPLATD